MQPREKRLVLEGLLDEGIDILLKRQLHAYADRTIALGSIGRRCTLVGGLHQTRSAAGDDVAAHFRQGSSESFDLVVGKSPRSSPRRAEDCHPISLVLRRAQPREVIDDIPQSKNRVDEDLLDRLFIPEADGPLVGFSRRIAHQVFSSVVAVPSNYPEPSLVASVPRLMYAFTPPSPAAIPAAVPVSPFAVSARQR
jgi:hypothetical protein